MYKVIAIAGTFDRLHKGHRYFISEAFKLGKKVIIGLTSDEFARKKLPVISYQLSVEAVKTPGRWQKDSFQVEEFAKRRKELEKFLKEKGLLEKAEMIKIEDVYGPSIKKNDIEALVVTAETLKGAEEVNRKRKEMRQSPLKIIKVPLILAQDKKRIASTRIRLGEIDRWGRVYISKIKNPCRRRQEISKINEKIRHELKKPLGVLIYDDANNLKVVAEELKKAVGKTNLPMIITVGDEVTKLCNEIGIAVTLAIVDFRVHREEKYHSLGELGFKSTFARGTLANGVGMVRNPPGHITEELVDAVKNAYLGIIKDGKQRIIQVDGEEDLAGVPAVLLAPLGSLVLYGQPGEGVVLVEVTEEKKQKLLGLMKKY